MTSLVPGHDQGRSLLDGTIWWEYFRGHFWKLNIKVVFLVFPMILKHLIPVLNSFQLKLARVILLSISKH